MLYSYISAEICIANINKMEDVPPIILVAPGKRALEDDVDAPISTPDNAAPSEPSTPLSVLSTMASPSPKKPGASYASASGSSNGSVTGDAPTSTLGAAATSGGQPLVKRRKLTIREKEEKKLEKEVKERVKAEKKAQRDQEDKIKAEQRTQKEEEKRVKDEERRKKNEEKEEKKKAKEFELQRKEEEKRKKEEDKLKKERVCHIVQSSNATTDMALVATEAQCLLRQAKTLCREFWKCTGRCHPEPYHIPRITSTECTATRH